MEQLKTSIKAVTVYPDRARVVHQGTLPLESGMHTLVVGELPLQEVGGVGPTDTQHTEERQRRGVDRLDWFVHGDSARILRGSIAGRQ